MFAITKFSGLEVRFHVFFYYNEGKNIVRYNEDFVLPFNGGSTIIDYFVNSSNNPIELRALTARSPKV